MAARQISLLITTHKKFLEIPNHEMDKLCHPQIDPLFMYFQYDIQLTDGTLYLSEWIEEMFPFLSTQARMSLDLVTVIPPNTPVLVV